MMMMTMSVDGGSGDDTSNADGDVPVTVIT